MKVWGITLSFKVEDGTKRLKMTVEELPYDFRRDYNMELYYYENIKINDDPQCITTYYGEYCICGRDHYPSSEELIEIYDCMCEELLSYVDAKTKSILSDYAAKEKALRSGLYDTRSTLPVGLYVHALSEEEKISFIKSITGDAWSEAEANDYLNTIKDVFISK